VARLRGRRFAPLWVYLFGLFAAAIAQTWLLPPRDHGAWFNVGVFVALASAVIVVLTLAERARRRGPDA
jgi:hypothetical protein